MKIRIFITCCLSRFFPGTVSSQARFAGPRLPLSPSSRPRLFQNPMNKPVQRSFQRALTGLFLGVSTLCLSGQPVEEAPPGPPPDIRLGEAISSALTNNFAFRISGLDPEIARQAITEAASRFDPELFAEGTLSQSEQNTTFSATTGTSSDSRSWRAGVRKRFGYGTSITAQTRLDRRDSNAGVNTSNLSQNADFSLSLRQPLLRGFGPEANLAELEAASAGYTASVESFRDTLLEILAQTERAYWNQARLQEQLALNESSLKVAEALLEEARERRRVGLATEVDVLQARASRAQRLEEIIETRRRLAEAADELLASMGLIQTEGSLASEAIPSVEPLSGEPGPLPDFADIWNRARREDPALARQEAVISQRELETRAADNAVRPSLDLVLSGAYIGVDDAEAETAYENALQREGHAWTVGLEFSLPWRMRGEKASLTRSRKRLEQERLRYQDLMQTLFREVRSAWRNFESINQSLEAAQLSVELQEATFGQEQGKFEEGISAFRDVLEAQRDLDQARIRLLQSKFNQRASEIDIARLTGSLFERHGLSRQNLLPD